MNLGFTEILIIAAVMLLLFGAKRLPELGRSLGQAIRDFQDGLKGKGRDGNQPPESS